MSATAIRMSSHAPSPSYVPRSSIPTTSRPNSPALPPKPPNSFHHGHGRSSSTSRLDSHAKPSNLSPALAPTPRMGPMERSSSGLRNEVKGEMGSQAAQAILKILSSLPAPLPETLPSTFLPTPSTSSTPSPPARTFTEYARSSIKRNKRKRPTDSSASASSDSSDGPTSGIGLGLGLSMSPNDPAARKKLKTEGKNPGLDGRISLTGTAMTPIMSGSSPALQSKKLGGSALRNEVGESQEQGKESWSRDKWRKMAQVYRDRALLLKRHGDAYQRSASAHPQFTSILPHDPLKGLLCHTDAALLWLYSYFCDEQGGGRVRSTPYNESANLRDFVRRSWESEMRKAPEEETGRREMAQAMVGLMHLIEAVVCYHLTSEQLAHLHKRGKELASSNGTPTKSPRSTTSGSPPGSASVNGPPSSQPHPSPAGGSGSSSSSPESTYVSYSLPPDLLPLISTSTSSSSRAQQHLLTSRHHLSLKLLRTWFPTTFNFAINSELNDEALPVPGDNLGSARRIDIDDHPEKFAWPIELGMHNPVAHTVAFGRCLVEEMAGFLGKEWVRVLE
ncbi:hypothetical protein I302_108466 [Kwoniella bestiolae CBS 10118]|uniref:Uncharacterized protein n=1 Tax=Kwoniella bestiolae CBS 10118 TaxID=1296100 RepID=A0A1B9FVM4_9TREE|nr:hypothetical protein I302_07158 [Kwoniella bestiolae CBS 10118]OCF22815.1 hypothetical protein I302_07158 [Kwoniella bestiolae CBS 10118]